MDELDALSATEKKREAEDAIEKILALFEEEKREPDDWEASDLLSAMGAIMGRMYALSLNLTSRAMAPPEEREGKWDREDTTPTTKSLRDTLAFIKGYRAD